MVILGGVGNLFGVVVGAVSVNVLLEVLRTPAHARWILYAAVLLGLVAKLRPWKGLVAVLAGTAAFGIAVHAIVAAARARGVDGVVSINRPDISRGGTLRLGVR